MVENAMVSFDKLKDVKPTGSFFDFRCPHCRSNDFDLSPLGISYRDGKASLDDLPPKVKEVYRNIPTLDESLVLAHNSGNLICFFCRSCKSRGTIQPQDTTRFTAWVHKKYGNYLDLGSSD